LVLPSGHTPGNRQDWRAKPGEGLHFCVCLHTRCRRLVQQRLQEMKNTWMIRKAEEIQGYADRKEMKNFLDDPKG
uniref:Cytochrome c oxidase assembly protein COX16 homolog, mitochondrial n=1 Tax=Schistocephalus solidus TaxID=70667 RepID=A0A183TTX3_SCHSO